MLKRSGDPSLTLDGWVSGERLGLKHAVMLRSRSSRDIPGFEAVLRELPRLCDECGGGGSAGNGINPPL